MNCRIFPLVLVCIFSCQVSFSQSGSTTVDRMKEEEVFALRLAKRIPYSERYQFKEFMHGSTYSSVHKKTEIMRLNYDIYFRQMSTIDEKGDTTFMPDFETIKYVTLDSALYFHVFQKGYFQLLSNPNDSVTLGVQRGLKVSNIQLMTDHETPQPVSTPKYFSVVYPPENPTYYRQQVVLSREFAYILIGQGGKSLPATRSNFIKLFPKHARGIDGYLRQLAMQKTPMRFSREEDLQALLRFCLSLR